MFVIVISNRRVYVWFCMLCTYGLSVSDRLCAFASLAECVGFVSSYAPLSK